MDIEVQATTIYTVHLDDEDVKKVKEWIKTHEDDLPYFDMKKNIAYAIKQLYGEDGGISLYDDGKATESDFFTEDIRWSEFERRGPEEILQ